MSLQTRQTVLIGPGTRHQLIESACAFGKHHLILHSPSVETVLITELRQSIESHHGHQCRFIPFTSPLLSLEQITKLVENNEIEIPETIIAIGGGSVIDAAKLLLNRFSHQLRNSSSLNELLPNADPDTASIPFFAIPTTCGSGAEATSFATHYLGTKKNSLEDSTLLPKFVALDDEMCVQLPKTVRISGGLDALTQAIESYWSLQSTQESRLLASQSITKIMAYFPAATNGDHQSLAEIQKAAFLSGRAINITRTTLCHALSYPLTAQHGIAHGLAVAASLPAIFKFNLECDQKDYCGQSSINDHKKRMEDLARLLGSPSLNSTPHFLSAWIEKIGGISKLTNFSGTTRRDIENIVTEALQNSRSSNNPRRPDKTQIINYILEKKVQLT